MTSHTPEHVFKKIHQLRDRMNQEILGQKDLIDEALCCLLSEGHLLMTGAPGLAKTTLVRAFADHLGIKFGRVQFAPDLLPSDIVGSEILQIDGATGKRSFEFSHGPVFVNLLLADEINRASPRTQSALLEAMQERGVTVGGQRYELARPFMVFATENPLESEGTFPLPEAQLDRFLIHSLVDYPDSSSEIEILRQFKSGELISERAQRNDDVRILSSQELEFAIKQIKQVDLSDELTGLIQEIISATRPGNERCPEHLKNAIWFGAGPRAGLALVATSRAFAFIEGRSHVRWQDIRRMAKPVMRHRMKVSSQAVHDGYDEDRIIDEVLGNVESRHKIS